jgi:hypothetical protein
MRRRGHMGDFMVSNQRYGRTLADFLPTNAASLPVHYDPDFDNYLYGQDSREHPWRKHPRSLTLTKLERGDVLFFVASLAPYDSYVYARRDELLRSYQAGRRNKYVIGFFTVDGVAEVVAFKSSPRLALALDNVRFMQEEGEALFDMTSLEKELEWLVAQGFAAREGSGYRLTRQDEVITSGEEIVNYLDEVWPEDQQSQMRLLEEGKIDISNLSGTVSIEDVKLSHHYKRLRPLDLDYFIVIKGDPNRSALLKRAVRLTERYKDNSFELNELGRAILHRPSDSLRGARWIDEGAVKSLFKEIEGINPELANKLP